MNPVLQQECAKIVEDLLQRPLFRVFRTIDARNISGYLDVIHTPMDLDTVQKKLRNGEYRSKKDYEKDMLRIFHNCRKFNGKGTTLWHVAEECQSTFEQMYRKIAGTREEAWTRDVAEVAKRLSSCAAKLEKLLAQH